MRRSPITNDAAGLARHQRRLMIVAIKLQLRRASRGGKVSFTRHHVLAVDRATSLARTLVWMLKEGS